MSDPVVIDWPTARPTFSPLERVLVPWVGVERFVRVRHAPAEARDPARNGSVSAQTPADAQQSPIAGGL